MKAVVLVGGEGTRLRPLTETMPKPLLPLMDRPSLDHVLDHLARHGVHEVVLSSSYLETVFHAFIEARRGDPKIIWITEDEPLGTGGAIVNALEHLGDAPFFALNGDILTDLDLTAMLGFHRDRGAAATIALTHVGDARPFGLVPTEPDGRVIEFREKPAEPIPGDINAGTYVLEPSTLGAWPVGENVSIERQVFPGLIAEGRPLYGFLSQAYWLDLGTPEKYLQAHFDMLAGLVSGVDYESPWVASTADIEPGAILGARSSIGAEARVGPGATVEDSVVHPGASIASGATVRTSIIGPGAHVGENARVTGSVLGAGSRVGNGLTVTDAKVPTDGEAPAS